MIKDNFGNEIAVGSRVTFVYQAGSGSAIKLKQGIVVRTKVYAVVKSDEGYETTVKPSRLVVM